MRAVVCDHLGPPEVLHVKFIRRPSPHHGEVLVRVVATTMTQTDCDQRHPGKFTGRLVGAHGRPKHQVGGRELAGEIEATGRGVTEFKVGDQVFGISPDRAGAHAEFVCLPQHGPLAHKPRRMSFEQAATVTEGAITALTALRAAGLEHGQAIAIHGAGGSIGTAAIQLARQLGATVTAVCAPQRTGMVASLGPDHVIDASQEDFSRNGQTYDVILDAGGRLQLHDCDGSLAPYGRYVDTHLLRNTEAEGLTAVLADSRVVVPKPPVYTQADVQFIGKLMEAGQYRAIIDRYFLLEDAARAARYVETGQAAGSVVLTVGGPHHLTSHARERR